MFLCITEFKNKKKSQENLKYITSDYAGEFKDSKRLNIESIDEHNNKYDLVICYHILEHIQHDLKAMKELYRIIKPKGECFIQTSFKTGKIYEK
jgi:2-polyprenyl-3-methyl-5-hydroxy-6-metoxy-1,4-benzoquinol methylase